MPKPPMNDTITIFSPSVDEYGKTIKDDFSRPKFTPRSSKARVQESSKVVQNSDGQEVQASLEIDLPPEEEIVSGYPIEWINRFNTLVKGNVLTMSETLNYSGSKVYFRTVFVG